MRTYQTVVIMKPDLDEAQVNEADKKVTQFIARFSGSVLKGSFLFKRKIDRGFRVFTSSRSVCPFACLSASLH